MIFYDCSYAPSPRRARMAIAEKGLHAETREVDLSAKEQFSDDFLMLNPRATVPVLVADDGTVLTENVAIAHFLDAISPEVPLMGGSASEKGLVSMWNAINEHYGLFALSETVRNASPGLKGRAITGPLKVEQISALAERGRLRTLHYFDMIESHLQANCFFAGANFSFADITALVALDFAKVVDLAVPATHTATLEWWDKVAARESASA